MMSNPAALLRMLITYAICVPAAIFLGYMMTEVGNAPDRSNLMVIGLFVAMLMAPVFIKWHYPILMVGIGCPMYMFFLTGNPPLWQVVVILSLGIAVVERALSSDRRFISVPSVTWPLMFLAGMAIFTAKMTGGVGLHSLGVSGGGGKKYISVFLGIAMYFALTSRGISKRHRKLYVGLIFLAGIPAFISDLYPVLPSPLNYINLFFPPSEAPTGSWSLGTTRLGAFASTAGVLANFMLASYGLRGIFLGGKIWRPPVFALLLILTLLGGFRTVIISYGVVLILLFFFEKLYQTRLTLIFILGAFLGAGLLVPFSNKLPFTFQRALSFLPLKWDSDAKLSAQDSAQWRYQMWHDLWPKVPGYLLVGKGYGISQGDMSEMIGNGSLANGMASVLDASEGALAIAGDYHSGPLSTLIPFGLWGAVGIIWLMGAGVRVLYLNFKYGDPGLHAVNALLLAFFLNHIISYFFIYGAFQNDVGEFAKFIGFSVAFNWGVRRPQPVPVPVMHIRPQRPSPILPQPKPQPA